jgi:flagellar biosynthesis/type III secretory pathway protein FliH
VKEFKEQVQDKIDEWIYLLKNNEIKKEFSAQGIQSAAKKLNLLRLSDEERRAYESFQDDLHYQASMAMSAKVDLEFERREALAESHARGHAEGHAEGEELGRRKSQAESELKIKQMQRELAYKLREKYSLDEIAVLMHLSIEELEHLLKPLTME